MNKIVALVPMRHDSQRVKGKNYRLLAGKPLYHHIISTLLKCPEISEVVVDTDSQPIMDGIKVDYPQVRVLIRPEHLRAGEIPMNEILLHDISQVEADFYLQTSHPSSSPIPSSSAISSPARTPPRSLFGP